MVKKRSPTPKQEKEAFWELGGLLEDLRVERGCSQVLLDKLEGYKEVWYKEICKKRKSNSK